jgi:colanic acid/amylovoran biosynthesis protein
LKLVPSRDRPFFEALRHADVVIAKGGSYLYSHGGASEILYLWRMLYPLRAALAAGRRPSVFGVTLGPFEPSFTARLAARVLGRCEAVYVREELSAETARGLLRLPPSTVVSIPDVAFSYESSARPTVDRYAIGFTVRSLPTHGAPTIEAAQRRYEEAIVAAGERQLAADPALKLVFVPQVLDDVGLGVRLRERFSDPSRVEVIEDDLAPDDLMAIYSSLELLVATRLHSAILAAVSGTPIIHLVYEREKGIGVMARLGLERWTRLSQELDGEDLARLIEKLRSESEEVRAHLTVRVPALRAEVEGALERLFNAGPNASE